MTLALTAPKRVTLADALYPIDPNVLAALPSRPSDRPAINTHLLERTLTLVVDLAEQQAEVDNAIALSWNQGTWRSLGFNPLDEATIPAADTERCGTAMCFAGWAATLDGGTWQIERPHDALMYDYPNFETLLARTDEVQDGNYSIAHFKGTNRGVPVVTAESRAREQLGLEVTEASRLFGGGNNLDGVRFYATMLLAGKDLFRDEVMALHPNADSDD